MVISVAQTEKDRRRRDASIERVAPPLHCPTSDHHPLCPDYSVFPDKSFVLEWIAKYTELNNDSDMSADSRSVSGSNPDAGDSVDSGICLSNSVSLYQHIKK